MLFFYDFRHFFFCPFNAKNTDKQLSKLFRFFRIIVTLHTLLILKKSKLLCFLLA